ncbi:MAG: hypothetical protein SVZ03_04910 [Spirochaetota bacterium]|nr:hypothetical protein [Spirochaetota bacterium]
MDKRRTKRYSISDYLDKIVSKEEYYIDILINGSIRAILIDISMCGLGYRIEEIDPERLKELQIPGDMLIKLYIADVVLFAEMKKVWTALIEDKGKKIIKGGLSFNVISVEDRLNLSNCIENIRKRI